MRNLLLLILLFPFLGVNSQKVIVESLKLQPTDLSASVNKVLDLNGNPCALLKIWIVGDLDRVEGNVIGKITCNDSEKNIYLSGESKEVRIFPKGKLPIHIVFKDYGIDALEQERTYILRLTNETPATITKEETNNNIPIFEFYAEDLVTMGFGQIPINNLNLGGNTDTLFETLKATGLNPTKETYGIGVFYTEDPSKCKGFNAIKRKFKLKGCDVIPDNVSMGFEPDQYSEGRITYQFKFYHGNKPEKRENAREQSGIFVKALYSELEKAGYKLEGTFKNAKGQTDWGEITLVYNDNYGECWIGLYVNNYFKDKK